MKLKFFDFLAQACFTLLLSIFLVVIYIAGIYFLHPGTLYYFGIGAIFVGAIILSIVFIILPKKIKSSLKIVSLETRDFFPCLLAAVFIMYSFHITIPTLADRSISIYVLNQLDEFGGKASLNDIQHKFLAGYVGGYSTVCRRISEQIENGNIVHHGATYALTTQGKRTIEFLRAFTTITGVNPYYVKSNDTNLLSYRYSATPEGECTPVSPSIKDKENVY